MNDVMFAIVLALAWFATVNAVASVAAAALSWLFDRLFTVVRPAGAALALFVLRMLPGALSAFFTIALFLPAHWRLEPSQADESAGYSLLALAAAGAAILAATAWRALAAARATSWIGRTWIRRSRVCARQAGGVPVYHLADSAPVVSLVGVLRPRLFVATQVFDSLTPDELEMSIAHEVAHLRSRDNLKRVLVACAPDLLTIAGLGGRVEKRWRASLEFAADAGAVRGDERRALNLVSALVKVARLIPAPTAGRHPMLAGSSFYEGALLSARIDRLLEIDRWRRQRFSLVPVWPISVAGLALLAALLPTHAVWLTVHAVTEGLVRILP
ncbi:MAG: M48 family metalloprotease [Acidobacteriota bacterium]